MWHTTKQELTTMKHQKGAGQRGMAMTEGVGMGKGKRITAQLCERFKELLMCRASGRGGCLIYIRVYSRIW